MIASGTRVIFGPPGAPSLHGVVVGRAVSAFAPAWPGAEIYLVRMGADTFYIIGDLLTVISAPIAQYAIEAGQA